MDAGAAQPQTPESFIGRTLGTCTIERVLGRGGMGVVFLAQQSRPHRQVAVKVLLLSLMPDPARRERFLQRFRREADAVAALEHPNILPVYEYGEQPDLAYIVMPYVNGGTLRDRVERKGALPLEEAAGFLSKAAVALDYAHNHGVIHRDVKPQNMLLYPDKRLMLSDFGIAKVAQAAAEEDGQPSPQLTTLGHVVGTPDYIAPEQAMGHEIDGRADIYSLGVVLFYMVTGRVPFVAPQPMTVAAKHVSEPPPMPREFRPDLPPAAEAVILKALAKKPAERYRTAGELARAFRAALPAQAAAPRPSVPAPAVPPRVATVKPEQRVAAPPPIRQSPKSSGSPPRRRWLPVVLALLAILLVSVGAYAAVKGLVIKQPNPSTTVTASPANKPTATHTATATATNTATPSPTSTTPPPVVYTASQFVPTTADLPGGTTSLSPVTSTTPGDFQKNNPGRVVDPTQGYNWQENISVQIDKSSNSSKYLVVAIDEFDTAADATKYFDDVVPHLTQTHTQQIGDEEIDGMCCDTTPTTYNVFYREHNVTVIILVASGQPSQANQDALSLAKKLDQHVHPSSALLQTDGRLALNRRIERWAGSNARSAAE
jgi:serine/threonine protein kinase